MHLPIMSVLRLVYITFVFVAVSGLREKRLILHAETDIHQELLNLRAEVGTVKSELQALKNELQYAHGSVYVRWGRTTCPQNDTTLVYKGYMAGKVFTEKGSGSNSICLPEDPTWGKYQDGSQSSRAHVYGTEFEEPDSVVYGKNVKDQDVPCAVCKVPTVSVMIPARVDCYPGWKREYTGYLVAHSSNFYSTDYVCVDGDPEFITRGAGDTDGHLLYLVEAVCGTLVCPPYFQYRELACVVCSL